MKDLSPKQVARAIGVSESSLKRWCDKGLIPTTKTAGGHRRLPVAGVIAFLRKSGQQPVQPEVLGLPPSIGLGKVVLERCANEMERALLAGNESQARRILFDLYMAGRAAYEICDQVIAASLRSIGFNWECGRIDVFEEHRACEIVVRLLFELRQLVDDPPENAPLAIGGAWAGDLSRLPTSMVEITLRELGWNAQSYGPDLPASSLCTAIEKMRPRVLWLSVSYFESLPGFLRDYERVASTAADHGAVVIVGGRALSEDVRRRIRYAAFCDNLAHLVSFATTLHPTTS